MATATRGALKRALPKDFEDNTLRSSTTGGQPAPFMAHISQFQFQGEAGEVTTTQSRISFKSAKAGQPSASTATESPKKKRKANASKTTQPATTDLTVSPKKKRVSSKYEPEDGKYAHLKSLPDAIDSSLLVLLVGHNPGVKTAETGEAYSHPSNWFWKLLENSGLTDRKCLPSEYTNLPSLYCLGTTNIVERPTKDTGELSKAEMVAGTPILEAKIRRHRPEVVCMVGKSIWESVFKYKQGRWQKKDEFHYGWQDEKYNMGVSEEDSEENGPKWAGAKVFVATTTSARCAFFKPGDREVIWKPLGDWVKQRRIEKTLESAERRTPTAFSTESEVLNVPPGGSPVDN
ncbi:DNA glycosylase [Microthyrium microscopicum]|uniref:DNA glycosylase n=1 Tax=Microthyrium microscopicum TaxID=703497 RepID=A0A6A6U7N2_9PEZI|nr:DNA glycosylase [Microthyrium microscopicum]